MRAIETGLVFDQQGRTLYWITHPGREAGYIPDSHSLWEFLWENRHTIGGVAHTHPWHGEASPSRTDVTTFDAIERGLGIRLVWPVITFTDEGYFAWSEESQGYLRLSEPPVRVADVDELRRQSRGE